MKKIWKQILCSILVALILTEVSPVPALADDGIACVYKTASLGQDTWVNSVDDYIYDSNTSTVKHLYGLYKISVPAGGYTKIDVKAINGRKVYSYETLGAIYKTIKNKKVGIDHKDNYSGRVALINSKEGRHFYLLKKGIYYIYASEDLKIRWSYTKPSVPVNFCRAKALKMEAGQKKCVFTQWGYEFDRWFKIDLPSKKSINVFTENLLYDYMAVHSVQVYRSNGKYIGTMRDKNTGQAGLHQYYTSAYPKGSYYIRVSRQQYPSETESYRDDNGRLYYLYWK